MIYSVVNYIQKFRDSALKVRSLAQTADHANHVCLFFAAQGAIVLRSIATYKRTLHHRTHQMTHNAQGAYDDKVKNLKFAMSREQVGQQWLAWVSTCCFQQVGL